MPEKEPLIPCLRGGSGLEFLYFHFGNAVTVHFRDGKAMGIEFEGITDHWNFLQPC